MMVIEGAGSAAEMNLRKQDLVNWPVVKMADAQVLLVADIDRGGVFAQILGTLDLLEPDERDRVCGVVVNKFRGDAELFADGVRFLESRSGVPVLGVIPYLRDLMLEQEDSLGHIIDQETHFVSERINIAVILLPHMSNFTDFNILSAEEDVVLKYASTPAMLSDADIVILPGSKSTVADLSYLIEKGFVPLLEKHLQNEREMVGICGGYQMLGRTIADPDYVEQGGTRSGLGYLNIETTLMGTKYTRQVDARPTGSFMRESTPVRGYEVHMGITLRMNERPCFTICSRTAQGQKVQSWTTLHEEAYDGTVRNDGLVWGTYIHGVFDEPEFRRDWLNRVRRRKKLPPIAGFVSRMTSARLQNELDRWADHVAQHLDISCLLKNFRSLNASRR
ncbi:MAG: cobyric acid synthase, partial [Nitrospira sp.]|nr:cobyric acid synthase [Nitrospira sp.]